MAFGNLLFYLGILSIYLESEAIRAGRETGSGDNPQKPGLSQEPGTPLGFQALEPSSPASHTQEAGSEPPT